MNKFFVLIHNYFFLPNKIKKVLLSFKLKGKPSQYKNILFCPATPSALNLARESIYALYTKEQTRKIGMMVYDEKSLQFDYVFNLGNKNLRWIYFFLAKSFVRICGLSPVSFKKYHNRDTYVEIKKTIFDSDHQKLLNFKHKNILLGDLALSSTIRSTLGNGPEWENNEFVNQFKEYLFSAYVIADTFEKIINSFNPDKIVMTHAIYVTWGTLFRVARSHDIPVDVYNASYQRNTLRFYHNIPNAPIPDGDWKQYEDIELSDEEALLTDKYISSRADNSMDNIQLFDKEAKTGELDKFIENAKKNNKTLFCLFTNIVWDAYLFTEDGEGENFDMLAWLKTTIQTISKDPNAALIIKAHPAEEFHRVPQKYRVKNLIKNDLTDNIFFIDEMTKIKPYYLYRYIDFGLAYISTVIIEMAIKGIPVICSGPGGQYSNKGFTIDTKSKSEYLNVLTQAIKKEIRFTPDIVRAKRFLYFRFYREAIPFQFLSFNKKYLSINRISKELHLEGLNTISKGILYDEKFIFDWTLKK